MHEETAQRAYAIWEAAGRPDGNDQAYWFKAIEELASEKPQPAIKRTRKRKAA